MDELEFYAMIPLFLTWFAEPWFVVPWYAAGVVGAAYVVYDVVAINRPLNRPLKWAWPIIVLFFSVLGLALYFASSRPRHLAGKTPDARRDAFAEYAARPMRKTTGAVVHCVAGDGLGIVTGMVLARVLSFAFWTEFWFEYAVGYLFGWLIFQRASMKHMADSKWKTLVLAFRAEFFSMLTVMAGMGAVMAAVTPLVVGEQPKPDTYAFWGFAMLGLLAGFILTFPMNFLMIKLGWKHGLGRH